VFFIIKNNNNNNNVYLPNSSGRTNYRMDELTKKNFNKNSDTSLIVGVNSTLKTVSCGLSHGISNIRNRMILSLLLADNFF
jgi:hypothetical protein